MSAPRGIPFDPLPRSVRSVRLFKASAFKPSSSLTMSGVTREAFHRLSGDEHKEGRLERPGRNLTSVSETEANIPSKGIEECISEPNTEVVAPSSGKDAGLKVQVSVGKLASIYEADEADEAEVSAPSKGIQKCVSEPNVDVMALSSDAKGFSRSPSSPLLRTTFVTKAVLNAGSQPATRIAHVHKVSLKNWDESSLKFVRRGATRSDGTTAQMLNLPAEMPKQSVSFGSLGAPAHVPVVADSELIDDGPSEFTGGKVRFLSTQEFRWKGEEAVQWFRASRAINRSSRSIEETEGLLIKARERRSSGTAALKNEAVKIKPVEKPPVIVEVASKPPVADPEKGEQRKEQRKRTVDPMALWSKPQNQKLQQQKEQPRRSEEQVAACMRGKVAVGAVGEDGLLARLRRKKALAACN